MEHVGTKFPTKEAVIAYLASVRPEWNVVKLEEAYQEQQEIQTIMLKASCTKHGSFEYHAYDEEGWHQYHTIPKCPQCEAAQQTIDPEKVAAEAEHLIQTDPKYKEILDDREAAQRQK